MTEPVARVDLNSDVGESFGRWTLDDAAMLTTVSSANIACGFHAGDPSSIRRSLTVAAANGVTVGAHVGYRDLVGFGRRDLDVDTPDLIADVIYQIGALQALAVGAGTRVSYVKPHGALYNRIVHDERQAEAVVTAITELDPSLVLLGLPGRSSSTSPNEPGCRPRPRPSPTGPTPPRGSWSHVVWRAPFCTTRN